MTYRSICLALGLLMTAGCAAPSTTEPATSEAPEAAPQRQLLAAPELPRTRVLLKTRDAASEKRAVAAGKGRVVETLYGMDVKVVELPAAASEAALKRMRQVPGVEWAELDGIATATACQPGFPNDERYTASQQWGLFKIQAPQAWALPNSTGNPTVIVAILDTGVDQNHPDIDPNGWNYNDGGKIARQVNFTNSRTIDDQAGHGTHCAGVAAARTHNCLGVAGVGFDSRIMNVKVLGDNSSGYYSWIINGINWAVANGAKVISMSLSGTTPSATLEAAVNAAAARGVLVVAAAGNSNSTSFNYPAAYPACLAVGATDSADRRASFSTYGPSWVDVAAPGVNIFSTLPNHNNRTKVRNYGTMSGTSMATPLVAGLAAALWPSLGNAAAVRNRIETTSVRSSSLDAWVRSGRIDMYRAMMNITN